MSDNVIPLVTRTAPDAEEYDGLVCDCGSAWFTAVVCTDTAGHVTGWKLIEPDVPDLTCLDCGRAVIPS